MTVRDQDSVRGRVVDWSLWAAAVSPLWALVVFSWVVLGQLRGEVREVARYYGVYMGKEILRAALARVASAMETEQQKEGQGSVSQEVCNSVLVLPGLERFLLVLDRESLNPVCSGGLGWEVAGHVLADEGSREMLFRVLRQMDRQQATEGFLSLGWRSGGTGISEEKWFVLLQPAGRKVLCTLLVPESELDRTGDSFQQALSVLVEKRGSRYLALSVFFCILVSAVIALLVQKGRPQTGPAESGGTHDRHPQAPDPLGRS